MLVDAGIVGEPLATPDVTRRGRCRRGRRRRRARAPATAAPRSRPWRGAAEVVKRLHAEGRLDAIGGLGGSGGSALVTHAMRQPPIGVPKLMVSTVASGDTSPYVGSVDVTMMYSVVDIAGVNRVSARIMTNAAGALAGMAGATVPPLGTRSRSSSRRCSASRPRRHHRARTARGARLRGARLPPDRCGRRLDGEAPRGRLRGRLARRDDDRVLRPGRGRRPRRRAGAARVGGENGDPAGRLARSARHGQLRPDGVGARALPRPEPLRPQPDDHAHATTPEECREIARIVAGKLNAATGPTVLYVRSAGCR